MSRFLLPCECGQKLQVTAAQAGEDLPCSCVRTVAVPTLRGMQSLERLESDAPPAAARQWSFRAGLGFFGLSIALVALLLVGLIHVVGPKWPTFPVDDSDPVDLSSPESIMHVLANITSLHRMPTMPELQQMKDDIHKYQFWHHQVCFWLEVAAGVGVVISTLSLVLPKRRGAPRPLPQRG